MKTKNLSKKERKALKEKELDDLDKLLDEMGALPPASGTAAEPEPAMPPPPSQEEEAGEGE